MAEAKDTLLNQRTYLYPIRIKYETREWSALYMIPLVSYRDTPLSCLVRLKGRSVHAGVLFHGTRQRSFSRGPGGHINAIMTSS